MPKILGPFYICKRQDTRKFQLILYPVSGLSPEICKKWQRKGFSRFPLELAVFREPKTRTAAEAGAMALIEYLKTCPSSAENGISLAKKDQRICFMLTFPGLKPEDVFTWDNYPFNCYDARC
jgi:hypothetical protein